MISDSSRPLPSLDGPEAPRATTRLRSIAGAMISLPGLAIWLVAVTLLAAGPLQALDLALDRPWSWMLLPAFRPFFVHVVDSFADPWVAMSVVSIVSLTVAWRRRSVRPLIVTAGAVISETTLVVTMKIVTARPRPMTGDPSFFQGLAENATIYPSGHAANAILIYGVVAYLITRYTFAGPRTVRLAWCGVAAVSVVATLTSLYLRWHWATDLISGLIVGALVLRATMTLDRMYPGGAWTPFRPLLWRLELLTWRLTHPHWLRNPDPVPSAHPTPGGLLRAERDRRPDRALRGH